MPVCARLAIAGTLAALSGRTALGDVVAFSPVADATMYEYTEVEGDLSNGRGLYLFTGRTGGNLERRALMRFDLSAIPAGATILSAGLTLTCSRTQTAGTTVHVFAALESWGEGDTAAPGGEGSGGPPSPGGVTWRHRAYPDVPWTFAGGLFNSAPSATKVVTGLGAYTWSGPDLTADVQAWVVQPGTNLGWVVAGAEASPVTSVRFDSRESPLEAARPMLVVEYAAPATCDADVNRDGNVDQGDVDYLISVVAGGPNPTGIDKDFNVDGNVDQGDVQALVNVVAGGSCP